MLIKLKMMYVNLVVNDALKPLRMVHAQMQVCFACGIYAAGLS